VSRVVEQHGSNIAVERQEGVGSTFTVRLPLRGAPPLNCPDSARGRGTTASTGGSHPALPAGARAELATAVAMLGDMGMAFWLPEAERELAEASE
jgi:hypothetical protein